MNLNFNIDPDITRAKTLPAAFYRSTDLFEAIKQKIFYHSWQWVGHESLAGFRQGVHPFILLEGFLTEPMLLSRDSDDVLHCLSNVCTHRGNLVVRGKGKHKKLICGYHGRRFTLDGRFEFMPEFKNARDFPSPCDDLHRFPVRQLGPFVFAGLDPLFDFQEVIDSMTERIGFLPLHSFQFDETRSKDYFINAHWALYCDNYLEGFHIPFVHEDLNEVLDYGQYDTVLYTHCNLQIGYADGDGEVFDLPPGHRDYGKNVAAYYYWVFPNMMFNFYPWGLSVNLVHPLGLHRTKVSFLSYVFNARLLNRGAGHHLDKVEMEDEAVVEGVQKGVRSHFYEAGRFSPDREKGVHHFHRLLADYLNREDRE